MSKKRSNNENDLRRSEERLQLILESAKGFAIFTTDADGGAALRLIQWLVLKSRLPSLSIWWVAATGIGMAAGPAMGTAFLGSETAGNELLWRGAMTGLCIGIAQWIILRQVLPLSQSVIWIEVVSLGWALGWFVTRAAGIDLSRQWYVFGMSGALTFQLLTGLALYFLLRSPKRLSLS